MHFAELPKTLLDKFWHLVHFSNYSSNFDLFLSSGNPFKKIPHIYFLEQIVENICNFGFHRNELLFMNSKRTFFILSSNLQSGLYMNTFPIIYCQHSFPIIDISSLKIYNLVSHFLPVIKKSILTNI